MKNLKSWTLALIALALVLTLGACGAAETAGELGEAAREILTPLLLALALAFRLDCCRLYTAVFFHRTINYS